MAATIGTLRPVKGSVLLFEAVVSEVLLWTWDSWLLPVPPYAPCDGELANAGAAVPSRMAHRQRSSNLRILMLLFVELHLIASFLSFKPSEG
jgi:hypothetical protein